MFLIRLATNWFCIITSPIWILPTLIFMIGKKVWQKEKDEIEMFLTGKQWSWYE